MGSLASQADAVDENMHMVSGADEMEVAAVLLIFFSDFAWTIMSPGVMGD